MEHLRRISVEGLANLVTIGFLEVGQTPEESVEFGLTSFCPARPQLLDHRCRGAMVHVAHKTAGLFIDDRECAGQFPLPPLAIRLARRSQIVDAVEPDARPLADPWIEVSRHCKVEHHQGPPLALSLDASEEFKWHDMVARAGRAHHEVGGGKFPLQAFKRRRPGVDTGCQVIGPGCRPIHDHHIPRPGLAEIPQRFGGHLARAHEQHPLVVEPLKNATGEVGHRHARDRHPLPAKCRLRRDPLGGSQRCLKQARRERPRRAAILRDRPGLLHLRKNLWFPKHHAVETRRHAEQVAHDRIVMFAGEKRPERSGVDPATLGEKRHELFGRRCVDAVLSRGVELNAIAGGEEHALAARKAVTKPRERLGGLLRREGEPLSQRQRHRAVRASDEGQCHGDSSEAVGEATAAAVAGLPCCVVPSTPQAIEAASTARLTSASLAVVRPPSGRERAAAATRAAIANQATTAAIRSTTGSVQGTVSISPRPRLTALSTMPEANPAAAAQAATIGVRAVMLANRSRLGMRKPRTGASLRARRPAWMSHIRPAIAPSTTLTLHTRWRTP